MSHLLDSSFYVIHKKTILNLHHILVHIRILEIPLFLGTKKPIHRAFTWIFKQHFYVLQRLNLNLSLVKLKFYER